MSATETKYYDGTKLLSMTDLNGKKPEIFICTSNRTAGKTTYFSRYLAYCIVIRMNLMAWKKSSFVKLVIYSFQHWK